MRTFRIQAMRGGRTLQRRRQTLAKGFTCALLMLALCIGCATGPTDSRAFSPEWAEQMGARPAAPREETNDNDNEVLIGDEEGMRIELDERGRPQVRTGENSGLEADVDVRGGRPGGGVGYRWEW